MLPPISCKGKNFIVSIFVILYIYTGVENIFVCIGYVFIIFLCCFFNISIDNKYLSVDIKDLFQIVIYVIT